MTAFVFFMGANAFAQNESNYLTPNKIIKYNIYEYPSDDSYFYLPQNFQTEFIVTNAKFFGIKYDEFISDLALDLDVYFYTPEDVLMGHVKIKKTDAANRFTIPHKANTLKCSTLKVKIINRAKFNKDFKFVVYQPVNSVEGVPVPGSKYIYGQP